MWQSLLVYNACPQPQTEATVLVSPPYFKLTLLANGADVCTMSVM